MSSMHKKRAEGNATHIWTLVPLGVTGRSERQEGRSGKQLSSINLCCSRRGNENVADLAGFHLVLLRVWHLQTLPSPLTCRLRLVWWGRGVDWCAQTAVGRSAWPSLMCRYFTCSLSVCARVCVRIRTGERLSPEAAHRCHSNTFSNLMIGMKDILKDRLFL